MVQPGKEFEQTVAQWVKDRGLVDYLDARYPEEWKVESVELNIFVNGLTVKRPYEIDVSGVMVGPMSILMNRPTIQVWIECKDRKSSIKRNDIAKLDSAAVDVIEANQKEREEISFNRWMLVSTSRFDSDAIKYATQRNINCVFFDGTEFKAMNEVRW